MSIPQISDSEWEIMKVIWKRNSTTSEEIIASLSEKKDWSPQTIKTFINRLLKKGAIGHKKNGRSYVYYSNISEKECVLAKSKSFIERVYDGAAAMFFVNFLEERVLSEEEIDKLQNILEDKKRK